MLLLMTLKKGSGLVFLRFVSLRNTEKRYHVSLVLSDERDEGIPILRDFRVLFSVPSMMLYFTSDLTVQILVLYMFILLAQ